MPREPRDMGPYYNFSDSGPQEFNRYGDGNASAPSFEEVREALIGKKVSVVINKETADSLERQAARLLARADEMRAKYDRFGHDDYPDGSVITFEKTFDHYMGRPLNRPSKPYFYAAIKDPTGRWSTTGPRAPKSYTWDELIQWMGDGVQEIYYVTKLERVV